MRDRNEFDSVSEQIINLLSHSNLDVAEAHLVLIGVLAVTQQLTRANIYQFWTLIQQNGIKLSNDLDSKRDDDLKKGIV